MLKSFVYELDLTTSQNREILLEISIARVAYNFSL